MKKLLSILSAIILLMSFCTGCGLVSDELLAYLLGQPGQVEETPPESSYSEMPPEPTPAPMPEPTPTPDPAAAVYAELYEVLIKAIDEHGYGQTLLAETGARSFYGLYYADLVDFDNDGIYELLYVYGDGEYVFTCEIHGYPENGYIHETDSFYVNHESTTIGVSNNGASYYIKWFGEIGESQTTYFTIIDGKWTKVLDALELSEYDEQRDDWVASWYVNGDMVDEAAYNNAAAPLEIASEYTFDTYSFVEGIYDSQQIDITMEKLYTLSATTSAQMPSAGTSEGGIATGSGATAGWDESAPMQINTADGNMFTVPITDWSRIEDYTYGGRIEINEPVGGIISRDRNFHRFTLKDMEVSNDFGLTLVIEASTDEPFEIYLEENSEYGIENGYDLGASEWFNSEDRHPNVTRSGNTMTIRIPASHYSIDTWVWQFNCPEYQREDGSDLKLKFAFLLEPGERPYEP